MGRLNFRFEILKEIFYFCARSTNLEKWLHDVQQISAHQGRKWGIVASLMPWTFVGEQQKDH